MGLVKRVIRALRSYTSVTKKESIREIEDRWMDKCQKGDFDINSTKPKYYVLPMFPYPSGSLHMGHVRVYTISDVNARYRRAKQFNVLHPIGWDSFGLPAENAAIERGIHPRTWTVENIQTMKSQLRKLCISFDWKHEISTCEKEYFKWTQLLFLKMYKDGYVYQKEASVNWDPVDLTVLANEQVDKNGRAERSGAKVEIKIMKQWFFKITDFASELVDGLDGLEWPSNVKILQRNWIGKRGDKLRLHDWLISRQRYWGTPIPMINCPECGAVPVDESELPVMLPLTDQELQPGKPLRTQPQKTKCSKCGNEHASRETDTMDSFVDSSWYWLRYCDPFNNQNFISEGAQKFLPVDFYIGGAEHSIMHLLYARFIAKYMEKTGIIRLKNGEPFQKLLTQGMVKGKTFKCPDSRRYLKPHEYKLLSNNEAIVISSGKSALVKYEKMSKSKYNGVDPIEIIEKYGADAVRLCVLYKAPPEDEILWEEDGIIGMQRWLARCLKIVNEFKSVEIESKEETKVGDKLTVTRNQTIEDLEKLMEKTHHYNVAISSLIKFTHAIDDAMKGLESRDVVQDSIIALIQMMHPFAPCTARKMWSRFSETEITHEWPRKREISTENEVVTMQVMINGKRRGSISLHKTLNENEIVSSVLHSPTGQKHLFKNGTQLEIKRIVIPVGKRVINLIV